MARHLRADHEQARKDSAKHRAATYDMEYGSVAEREAKRGYPAKLNAQQEVTEKPKRKRAKKS